MKFRKNCNYFPFLIILTILQLGIIKTIAQNTLQFTSKVYVFTGNGNWSKVSNWQGSIKPPGLVPKGDSILIQTAPGDTCLLDVVQYLDVDAVLKVVDGSFLIIKNGIVQFVPADSSFTDTRDGKIYPIKKYGTQTWMTINLNYNQAGSIVYDNDPANAPIYGRLYDWDNSKTACPSGWHLPTMSECTTLNNLIGSGTAMRDTLFWLNSNLQANNSSAFSARPGGFSENANVGFEGKGEFGVWWTSTQGHSELGVYHWAWAFWLGRTGSGTFWEDGKEWRESVRCVKN